MSSTSFTLQLENVPLSFTSEAVILVGAKSSAVGEPNRRKNYSLLWSKFLYELKYSFTKDSADQ